jgi:hypothetical protein
MNITDPSISCPRRRLQALIVVLVVALAAMGLASEAMAQYGYAQDVKDLCKYNGRPVPSFSNDDCTVCHVSRYPTKEDHDLNAKGEVYEDIKPKNPKKVLDTFCPADKAPVLDSIVTPRTATAGKSHQFTVRAIDKDDDKLNLTAKPLPKGAKLGKAKLVKGKWTSSFTWKPATNQTGKKYTITFTATEAGVSPALKDSQAVAIKVSAPSTSPTIKEVEIEQSQYRSGKLTVAGKVEFKTPPSSVSGLSVKITDGAGAALGSAPLSLNGKWTFSKSMSASAAPCQVQAEIKGVKSEKRGVKPIPSGCEDDDGDDSNDED